MGYYTKAIQENNYHYLFFFVLSPFATPGDSFQRSADFPRRGLSERTIQIYYALSLSQHSSVGRALDL